MIGKKVTIIFLLFMETYKKDINQQLSPFDIHHVTINDSTIDANTKSISKSGKSVDGRWLGRLEARAKRDLRMETEGDAVDVRRNEPRCCQLTGTTWIEHVTRVSFLFTLHYTATMKRGNHFLPGLQHPRKIGPIGSAGQPRICLPRDCSSYRWWYVFHPRYTDLCCREHWRI